MGPQATRDHLRGGLQLHFPILHLATHAFTDPENAASVALLGRLGFKLEGQLRGEWETHIGVRDSLIFGLLAEEWRG